jgi:hypothetical protein
LRTITRQLPPRPEPGLEAEVEVVRRGGLEHGVGVAGARPHALLHGADERLLTGLLLDVGGLREQRLPDGAELARRVAGRAEVGQAQALRLPRGDDVQRALPRLDVDVGRGRGREREVVVRQPHAGHVAHERPAGRPVQVADVVGGVAGRVLHAELAVEQRLAAGEGVEVALGHRHDLAPQPVEPLLAAVEARRAGDEPLRVGEVRRAALVDVDGQVRPAAHERPGGSRVVEVDVGQQQRPRLLAVERVEERVLARLRAGVDEHPVDLPAADDLLPPHVEHVDGPHMGGEASGGLGRADRQGSAAWPAGPVRQWSRRRLFLHRCRGTARGEGPKTARRPAAPLPATRRVRSFSGGGSGLDGMVTNGGQHVL